ncbi:MAG: hypothetical protein IT207_10775 [Fimbriimonadaceae bacterium]|nr:hypothetical protein [Fimbriimonadaceae bacterium]
MLLRLQTRAAFAALLVLPALSLAGPVRVEVGSRRAPEAWSSVADHAVRFRARSLSLLSEGARSRMRRAGVFPEVFSLPTTVVLTDGGRPLPPEESPAANITLVFDTTGSRAFTAQYRQQLEQTFADAKSVMDSVFGPASVGGPIKVKNYDADIQDRYAVAGGYFVPNAPGGPEIRFPVYNNLTAASINFVHTLLLAYQNRIQPPFDAYSEGMARAATAIVSRVPGTIPGATALDIEGTLEGLYDVTSFYDWYNSTSLGAPRFIAPNLLNVQLPPGGSTGGVFLLRYQMAGSSWLKLMAERPAFLLAFRSRYDLAPTSYQTVEALEALGDQALQDATGVPNPTVEGLRYAAWAERQAILDVSQRPGLKVISQPFPAPPIPGSGDFGLFGIVLNAFQTEKNGDETLLAGESWPLYFLPDFARTFLTAQEDKINVSGAFGSVVANFPGDSFSGAPYRMVVDLPFRTLNARSVLPAGAISTGSDPEPRTFFGTLVGLPEPLPAEYQIVVDWIGGRRSGIRVHNFAFGEKLTDAGFLKPGPLLIRVYRVEGTSQVLLFTRKVNKTVGAIALDLRPPTADTSYSLPLRSALQSLGLPIEPYRPDASSILGELPGDTLWARWNPLTLRNDLYPKEGSGSQGLGYWARPPAVKNAVVSGRNMPNTPILVALSPGWNMVSTPFDATAVGADILVTTTTEAMRTLAEGQTDGILGPSMFRFEQSATNPDEGTMEETDRIRPGEATWVRCDRGEGAVLLFVPRSASRPSFGDRSSRDARARAAARRTLTWEGTLRFSSGRRDLGSVRIGTAKGATGSANRFWDSTPPSSIVGARVYSVGSGFRLYRDIREPRFFQSFHVRLTGLVPGVRYRMSYAPTYGASRVAAVRDGRQVPFGPGNDFLFTARASSETIEVATAQW